MQIGGFGQNIDAKIDSLYFIGSGEEIGCRVPTVNRILRIDPSNLEAHSYMVRTFYMKGEYNKVLNYIDSINKVEESDPELLLGLSKYLLWGPMKGIVPQGTYGSLLSRCLKSSKTKPKASFLLSEYYYEDFIAPYLKAPPSMIKLETKTLDDFSDQETAKTLNISIDSAKDLRIQRNIPKSKYKYSVDSALKYLNILMETDSAFNHIAMVPKAQLERYLGFKNDYELDSSLYNNHYFPEWYFGYLSENWKDDITIDLFQEMLIKSHSRVNRYSKHLESLNEPILYPNTTDLTYRITFLPVFHHPIVIRIEINDFGGKMFWKVGKGVAGNTPEGLLAKGEVMLEEEAIAHIVEIIESMKVCSSSHYDHFGFTDGESFIIEKVDGTHFCAYGTNVITGSIHELVYELSQSYFKEVETGLEK